MVWVWEVDQCEKKRPMHPTMLDGQDQELRFITSSLKQLQPRKLSGNIENLSGHQKNLPEYSCWLNLCTVVVYDIHCIWPQQNTDLGKLRQIALKTLRFQTSFIFSIAFSKLCNVEKSGSKDLNLSWGERGQSRRKSYLFCIHVKKMCFTSNGFQFQGKNFAPENPCLVWNEWGEGVDT